MSGYFRFPTIFGDTVVFVCEDDLWSVPVEGGVARRLTASPSAVSGPCFSPDGTQIAFTARDEGPWEVYCMPAEGGEARRLTYQGAVASVAGWSADGRSILYSSNSLEHGGRSRWLWTIAPDGGFPERLPYGKASSVAQGPQGGVVVGRNTGDPATWKRYRGGTAGRLFIDIDGSGRFKPLVPTDGNLTAPMWIGERIYFVSDHEGIGNLYSCLPDGSDLRRHTHHEEYYCRNPRTDGRRIVYQCGAALYLFDPESESCSKLAIEMRSPRTQCQRRFVDPARYLQEYSLHPDGQALALTIRGKLFTMANWEGAVLQHGERDGVRYRLAEFLNDGKRLVTVADSDGEEGLEIHFRDGSRESIRLRGKDIGRASGIAVSPKEDKVVLRNHRHELLLVDLEKPSLKLLDRSPYEPIGGTAWSPDGRWLAYSIATTERTRSIRVCRVETGEKWTVTAPEFHDVCPSWDPAGNYLYFLSYREFNPVYDELHFDLGFPQAMRPMLVTLRKDVPNPFIPMPRPIIDLREREPRNNVKPGVADALKREDAPEEEIEVTVPPPAPEKPKDGERVIEIDFDGIERRVVAFPYPEGRYGQIAGIEGKVLLTSFPLEGSLGKPAGARESDARGALLAYDFRDQRKETLVNGVNYFVLSRDARTLAYRSGARLRVVRAGDKPADRGPNGNGRDEACRQTGWIDLGRVKVSVVPRLEWKQMYREAWRLQREFFWSEDMSGIDWKHVYERYLPQLERVATRSEFSDLMWEMQGELGTSHAYEFGGDYRPGPNYQQGFLGADFQYDEETAGYRIQHIVCGDSWDESKDSPLNRPGINVKEGDILVAIGGQRLSKAHPPGELLVNQANQEVELTLLDRDSYEPRTVTVKALAGESEARYREWVSRNRRYVHEKTEGLVGYVHIPDMGPRGYAEFHRAYLAEVAKPALIIDVRFNGGGHVSALILEKLSRRRIGYDVRRWGTPIPYPYDSPMGPLVAITNELAGSDGDIFSHCFKLMKLGPLVGTRTWGGVVGISPKTTFVDGGTTTQPEFSFWFVDVGWNVENHGTEPDIKVDYLPQDFIKGRDPQLDRAIKEAMKRLKRKPPRVPEFGERPRRALPRLPKVPKVPKDKELEPARQEAKKLESA